MKELSSGKELRAKRISLNLTLQDVANELGMNKSTISRYERGKIPHIKKPMLVAMQEFYKRKSD